MAVKVETEVKFSGFEIVQMFANQIRGFFYSRGKSFGASNVVGIFLNDLLLHEESAGIIRAV